MALSAVSPTCAPSSCQQRVAGVTMVVEGAQGLCQGGDQSELGGVRRQWLPRTPPEAGRTSGQRDSAGVFSPGHL